MLSQCRLAGTLISPPQRESRPFPVGFTVRHLPLSQADADEVARATKIDCTEENGIAMKDIYTILLNETGQSKVATKATEKMPTAVVKKVIIAGGPLN